MEFIDVKVIVDITYAYACVLTRESLGNPSPDMRSENQVT
jgi:hypothetical protein